MSNMKEHLAEFERMKAELEFHDGSQRIEWGVRRLAPFPLGFAVMMAYHAGVEAQLCWWLWRRK